MVRGFTMFMSLSQNLVGFGKGFGKNGKITVFSL
jgi:hypothetical protein